MIASFVQNRLETISRAVATIEQEAKHLEFDVGYEKFCTALSAVAFIEQTITYKGLVYSIGIFSNHLAPMLARRMEEDHSAGRYLSCALAVSIEGISSPVFFEKARQLGYEISDERKFWQKHRDGAWADARL